MELTTRMELTNWLTSQGLTGLAENDLVRGFCERCCAAGLDLSRSLIFIDTLHPIFEGRGFRWNDSETNESDSFEYGPTDQGDAAQNWRRSVFFHMLEHGHDEVRIDLADHPKLGFTMLPELAEKGHRHMAGFVHRFGEAGALGQMDCFYSYWLTRRAEGFNDRELAALRDLVPVLGLAIKSAAQVDIARTLGRVYLARNDGEAALKWFDAAITRNPQLGEAQYYKALAHLTRTPAEPEKAVTHARAARSAGYPNADALLKEAESKARE